MESFSSFKGIYQDVISYEPMIESVQAKADDLASKSPISKATTDTSQILTKYQTIKDQAMVRTNSVHRDLELDLNIIVKIINYLKIW